MSARRLVPIFLLSATVSIVGGEAPSLSAEQARVLDAIRRGEAVAAWPELNGSQAARLSRKAEAYWKTYQRYHLVHGLTADVLYTDYQGRKLQRLEGIGDSVTWTGHYLAALAFRYAVTRDRTIIKDIHSVLDAYHVLTHVTGKDGYIARFAAPSDIPAYREYYKQYGRGPDPNRPGFGNWAYPGVEPYIRLVWLGNSSRDVYDGVNLGLATAHRLVPDSGVRARISALVRVILDRLIQDQWFIVDGKGHSTRPTNSMKATLLRTGATIDPARYEKLYRDAAQLVVAAPAPNTCKSCDYFPNNLNFIIYYVLATLEDDAGARAAYQEKISAMWKAAGDHLNPWFAAIYLSATGDRNDVKARATVQGVLYDFPDLPRWSTAVDNDKRPGIETVETGKITWARYALPVRERPISDFMWQRPPTRLAGGADAPLEYPGIDVFLPYWLGRHAGVIR